jgi:hydroxymethylglutaryl-CoA lyase
MMARSGVETGIDLGAAIAANKWFAGHLGRELPSAVARAA